MSSMYIPNIEEPRTCCQCKMHIYNPEIKWYDAGKDAVGGWVCLLTGELIDNTKREEHCPVIFVSNHRRLIDADALLETEAQHWITEYNSDGYAADEIGAYTMVQIDAMPTIIPADRSTE